MPLPRRGLWQSSPAARWVLKHGRYARALAPKELVEEVKKQCDEMLRLYE